MANSRFPTTGGSYRQDEDGGLVPVDESLPAAAPAPPPPKRSRRRRPAPLPAPVEAPAPAPDPDTLSEDRTDDD